MNNIKRFSEILVEKGILKIGDVNGALFEQQLNNRELNEILVSQQLVTYEDIVSVLIEQGWERVDVLSVNVDVNIISATMDIEKLIKNSVLPIRKNDKILEIAIYNPYNKELLDDLKIEYNADEIIIKIDNKELIDKKLLELFPLYMLNNSSYKKGEELSFYSETDEVREAQYFNVEDDDLEDKIKEYIIDAMKNKTEVIKIIKDNTIDGLYKVLLR